MNDHTPILPTPPSTPAPAEYGHGLDTLTSEEALKMIEWQKIDVAMGRATPDQAAKAFDQLGATEAQRAPDNRSDDVKALDAAFPVAKPHEFVIRWNAPGDETPMTPELKALDTAARGWMVAGGMPANVGNSLVNAITQALQATKGMTESQLEQRGCAEMKRLEQVHGDKLEERLDAVNRLVHAIEATSPGVYRFLKSPRISDDAMVMNILMNHAPLYHARKGR